MKKKGSRGLAPLGCLPSHWTARREDARDIFALEEPSGFFFLAVLLDHSDLPLTTDCREVEKNAKHSLMGEGVTHVIPLRAL